MEKSAMIELIIILFLSVSYCVGIVISVYPDLRRLLFQLEEKRRRQNEYRTKRESNFDKELRYMLIRSELRITPRMFKLLTAAAFVTIYAISARLFTAAASIMIAMLIAATPYLYLKMRLERTRSRGSQEAEALVSNLLIQYRISNNNIEEAIEKVIASGKLKATKQPLYSFLIILTATRNKAEIKDAAETFSFSIGTLWSKMVAHSIYHSAMEKADITLALEDILNQLKEARVIVEERKRINAESDRMIWMIPVFYFGSILLAVKYCNITLSDYLENQFNTSAGIGMFLIILVFTLLDCYLLNITRQRKFDF